MVMTEDQIRQFVDDATGITGDRTSVIEEITARWLQDREDAADQARDAIYDDARDSWDSE